MRFSLCLIIVIVAVANGIKPKYIDLTLHTVSGNTGDVFEYQWFPIVLTSAALKVRAEHDARIAFKFRDGDTTIAEISLGQDSNTKSSIRVANRVVENVGNDTLATKGLFDTPNILDKHNYRLFWVSWENSYLKFGFWGAYQPFMYMKERLPFQVNFIGVATGYGAEGDWRIEDQDDYLGNALDNLTSRFAHDYSLLIPIKLKPNVYLNLQAIPVATHDRDKLRFSLEFKTESATLDVVNIEPSLQHRVFWIDIKLDKNARVKDTDTRLHPASNAKPSFTVQNRNENGVHAKYLKISGSLSMIEMIRMSIDGDDIKEYWLTPRVTRAFTMTKNKCKPDVDLDKPWINLRGLTYENTYDPHQ